MKYLLLAVSVVGVAMAGWGGCMRSQRDAARAEQRAAEVDRDAARREAKGVADAARQCASTLTDERARAHKALADAAADAEGLHRALAGCRSDEAVAARLGEVTK